MFMISTALGRGGKPYRRDTGLGDEKGRQSIDVLVGNNSKYSEVDKRRSPLLTQRSARHKSQHLRRRPRYAPVCSLERAESIKGIVAPYGGQADE